MVSTFRDADQDLVLDTDLMSASRHSSRLERTVRLLACLPVDAKALDLPGSCCIEGQITLSEASTSNQRRSGSIPFALGDTEEPFQHRKGCGSSPTRSPISREHLSPVCNPNPCASVSVN